MEWFGQNCYLNCVNWTQTMADAASRGDFVPASSKTLCIAFYCLCSTVNTQLSSKVCIVQQHSLRVINVDVKLLVVKWTFYFKRIRTSTYTICFKFFVSIIYIKNDKQLQLFCFHYKLCFGWPRDHKPLKLLTQVMPMKFSHLYIFFCNYIYTFIPSIPKHLELPYNCFISKLRTIKL